ncbi:MAG: efflux RND transporter periplasmic adaptor subunit [Roseiflexaceae bacterium]
MTDSPREGRISRSRLVLSIIGLLAVVAICAAVVFAVRGGQSTPLRTADQVFPRRDTIIATVNATGQIAPAQTARLNFASVGRVERVRVKVGQTVRAGDPLAELEARELELRLAQADAQLTQAQANAQKLRDGATPEEIEASQAQLRQAQAQLRQTSGSVTPADIRAAEAQLAQAQAQLQRLTAGPRETDLRTSEAQLAQAQAQLSQQRDQLSAAKTNASIQLEQAVNSLTQAQSRYATAKQNWEHVRDTGTDPYAPSVTDPTTRREVSNTLNEAQRQQYYDTFVQAEAALRSAENNVSQAQVSYDNARQAEVNGIRVAEQQVQSAQAGLDRVRAGADNDQIAAARAQVQSAQANLAKLRGDQRSGALAAAQASVDLAEANLARLRGGPQASDLTVAEAQVQSAQAARDLAQLALDQTTLRAPFDGVVAEINLQVGENPPATSAAVVLADLSNYYVDVAVDEIDVARVQISQPVTLTLDALAGLALAGTVESIAPLSTAQSSVTSYQVRITIQTDDERVRPGMSTNADIVVARKTGALLLPRRAVRNDRGRLVVDVTSDPAVCSQPREQRPANLGLTARDVQTGLSNEQLIEILSGVDEQSCVNVEGFDARANPLFGGPPRAR